MKKLNPKVKITLISIITVIAVIGISYAFFSSGIIGNEEDKVDVQLNNGSENIIVTYDETNGTISAQMIELSPEDRGKDTLNLMKFTVTNNSSSDQKIKINWINVTNTFCEYQSNNSCTNIETDTYVGDEIGYLIYSCSEESYNNLTAENAKSNCTLLNERVAPLTGDESELLKKSEKIEANKTNYYALIIRIKNLDTNQNYQANASFNGAINVSMGDNTLEEAILLKYTPQSDENVDFSYTSNGCNTADTCAAGTVDDEAQITNGLYINNKENVTNDPTTGTIKYFRGDVDNYVSFGGVTYRVIRINEDGSIKLITEETPITNQAINTSSDAAKYVGYTYDDTSATTNDGTASNAKTQVETWYETNITNKGLDSYVKTDKYCNDTSTGSTSGSNIYYGAYTRQYTNKIPTYDCPETDKTYGGEYELKVGLITADETMYAGGLFDTANTNYYLNNNTYFWTMSPLHWISGTAYVFYVYSTGPLHSSYASAMAGLRPVITLVSDIEITSGDGTSEKPWVIKTN